MLLQWIWTQLHSEMTVVFAFLAPMASAVGIVVYYRRRLVNRNRRSPLTMELLRTPGYGLQRRLEDIEADVILNLMLCALLPVFLYCVYLSRLLDQQAGGPQVRAWIYLSLGIGGFAYFLWKLVRLTDKRIRFREALAGELATAQCLEPVIAGGGRIFHDLQAEGFNIDHVVVAPGGVFAIETKHRLKPVNADPKNAARVRFDGNALHFPDWVETAPLEQAKRQAAWLSKFLAKSTGEPVEVVPVLALPGWFVELGGRSDVRVVNPKVSAFMLKPLNGQPPIPPDRQQRICYQLEQRCQEPPEAKTKRAGPRNRVNGRFS